MTTALLDAEAAAHACAHAAPDADAATAAAVGKVNRWIDAAGADRAVLAFSCPREACFRRELWPGYKARRGPPHPFVAPVVGSLKRTFSRENTRGAAEVVERPRIEADDVLGMLATWPGRSGCVIVARDGDLLQVPGRHYRPGTSGAPGEWIDVSADAGDLAFHTAVLTGCSGDGVPGLAGCGEVGARKVLAGVPAAGRWEAVVRAYRKRGRTEEEAVGQARLVRVLRAGEYVGGEVRLWEAVAASVDVAA